MLLNQADSIKPPTPVVGKVGQFEKLSLQDWNCRKLSTTKISINLSIGSQKPAELNANAAHRGMAHNGTDPDLPGHRDHSSWKALLEPTAIYTELHFAVQVCLIAESKGGFSSEI